MALYWVTAATAASPTAAFDAIELVEAGTGLIAVRRVLLYQTTDLSDAAEEVLRVEWIRGTVSASGSGGQTTAKTPLDARDSAATFTAELLNTTTATITSPVSLYVGGWNIRIPLDILFPPGEHIIVRNGEVAVFRVSAPADAITVQASCLVEEL